MEEFYRSLPKAELHVHLEGSLEPETLREIDSSVDPEFARLMYQYEDFQGFISAYKWVLGLLRGPADYALAARRLFERLAAENVRYAEVTLSAGAALWLERDVPAIYDAVTREAARSPVDVWWVFDAVRQFGSEEAMKTARMAAERSGDRVVAFGIGGDESRGPTAGFAGVFRFAKEQGLKLVPHAGETEGPDSVREALDLGADRIGHGIRAVEDPALLARLRDEGIPLEVCVSSNLATGAVASYREHPLHCLYEAGVPVVLNTDDPAMFHTTLSREYALAERDLGFTREELAVLAEESFARAFRASAA